MQQHVKICDSRNGSLGLYDLIVHCVSLFTFNCETPLSNTTHDGRSDAPRALQLTWEPCKLSPLFAIETVPLDLCLRRGLVSASKNLAWSPNKDLENMRWAIRKKRSTIIVRVYLPYFETAVAIWFPTFIDLIETIGFDSIFLRLSSNVISSWFFLIYRTGTFTVKGNTLLFVSSTSMSVMGISIMQPLTQAAPPLPLYVLKQQNISL